MSPPQNDPTHVPAYVCLYGPSGSGKTTDCLYAMPRALYIATPGALKPSVGVVGFALHSSQIVDAPDLATVTKLLPKLNNDFDGVVVDDFSLLVERELARLESRHTGFKLWGALRDSVLEFRDVARACKKHVLTNAHESPPQTKANGKYVRGGPKLPSDLPETFPVQCDLVLRAFNEPSRTGAWKMVYRCGPNDFSYVTKDRHSVTPDMAPMNVGEILRAAGYTLRRAPGLEWMEPVVEKIAQRAAEVPFQQHGQLAQQIVQFIAQSHTQDLRHIRWALRDGFDRWTIRVARQNILSGFLTPSGGGGLTL